MSTGPPVYLRFGGMLQDNELAIVGIPGLR